MSASSLSLLLLSLFGLLSARYALRHLLAWGWERRQCRAMSILRLQPERLSRKVRITVTPVTAQLAPLPVEQSPSRSPVCRWGECATLYLNGELLGSRRQWFDKHRAHCHDCWVRFTQEELLKARDVRCLWETDIRAYTNHKLSGSALEQFKGHLTICEYCTKEVEDEEECADRWRAEWEPIWELEYHPRSHGESST